jgi:hypothetical protein
MEIGERLELPRDALEILVTEAACDGARAGELSHRVLAGTRAQVDLRVHEEDVQAPDTVAQTREHLVGGGGALVRAREMTLYEGQLRREEKARRAQRREAELVGEGFEAAADIPRFVEVAEFEEQLGVPA